MASQPIEIDVEEPHLVMSLAVSRINGDLWMVCSGGFATQTRVMPPLAQAKTLQGVEILTRSVSEEIGCGRRLRFGLV